MYAVRWLRKLGNRKGALEESPRNGRPSSASELIVLLNKDEKNIMKLCFPLSFSASACLSANPHHASSRSEAASMLRKPTQLTPDQWPLIQNSCKGRHDVGACLSIITTREISHALITTGRFQPIDEEGSVI